MMEMLYVTLLILLIAGIASTSAQGDVAIHPSGAISKCLGVRNNRIALGTAIQIYDCNGSISQKWVIIRGSTTVQLAGTNFCLDSIWKYPNVGLMLWQCSEFSEHLWNFTSNGNIKVQNTNLCLNLPYGTTQNGVQVETQTCGNGQSEIWQV